MDRQGYTYAIGFLMTEISSTFEDFPELGDDRKVFQVRVEPDPNPRIVVLCNQNNVGYGPFTDGELAERTIIKEILPVGQETPANQPSKEGYKYMLGFMETREGDLPELGPDQKWIPVRFGWGNGYDGWVVLCNEKDCYFGLAEAEYAKTTLR